MIKRNKGKFAGLMVIAAISGITFSFGLAGIFSTSAFA